MSVFQVYETLSFDAMSKEAYIAYDFDAETKRIILAFKVDSTLPTARSQVAVESALLRARDFESADIHFTSFDVIIPDDLFWCPFAKRFISASSISYGTIDLSPRPWAYTRDPWICSWGCDYEAMCSYSSFKDVRQDRYKGGCSIEPPKTLACLQDDVLEMSGLRHWTDVQKDSFVLTSTKRKDFAVWLECSMLQGRTLPTVQPILRLQGRTRVLYKRAGKQVSVADFDHGVRHQVVPSVLVPTELDDLDLSQEPVVYDVRSKMQRGVQISHGDRETLREYFSRMRCLLPQGNSIRRCCRALTEDTAEVFVKAATSAVRPLVELVSETFDEKVKRVNLLIDQSSTRLVSFITHFVAVTYSLVREQYDQAFAHIGTWLSTYPISDVKTYAFNFICLLQASFVPPKAINQLWDRMSKLVSGALFPQNALTDIAEFFFSMCGFAAARNTPWWKKCVDLMSYFKSLEFFYKGIKKVAILAYSMLYEKVTGEVFDPFTGTDLSSLFARLTRDLKVLQTMKQNGGDRYYAQAGYGGRINALYADSLRVSDAIWAVRDKVEWMPSVTATITECRTLYEDFTRIVKSSRSRVEPVMFYGYGKAGCGKSTITSLFAEACAEKYGIPEELVKWSKPKSSDYFDGYNYQVMFVHDECFADLSAEATTKDAAQILDAVSSNAYMLDMSPVNLKGNFAFDSEFYFALSNWQIPKTTVSAEALARRPYIYAEIEVTPEYRKESFLAGKKTHCLDYAKMVADAEKDPTTYDRVWIFHTTLGRMTFSQMVVKMFVERQRRIDLFGRKPAFRMPDVEPIEDERMELRASDEFVRSNYEKKKGPKPLKVEGLYGDAIACAVGGFLGGYIAVKVMRAIAEYLAPSTFWILDTVRIDNKPLLLLVDAKLRVWLAPISDDGLIRNPKKTHVSLTDVMPELTVETHLSQEQWRDLSDQIQVLVFNRLAIPLEPQTRHHKGKRKAMRRHRGHQVNSSEDEGFWESVYDEGNAHHLIEKYDRDFFQAAHDGHVAKAKSLYNSCGEVKMYDQDGVSLSTACFLALKGRIILINAHMAYVAIENKNGYVSLKFNGETNLVKVPIASCVWRIDKIKDRAAVQFPLNSFSLKRDITTSFVKEKDMQKKASGTVYRFAFGKNVDSVAMTSYEVSTSTPFLITPKTANKYVVMGLCAKGPDTKAGDCGTFYMPDKITDAGCLIGLHSGYSEGNVIIMVTSYEDVMSLCDSIDPATVLQAIETTGDGDNTIKGTAALGSYLRNGVVVRPGTSNKNTLTESPLYSKRIRLPAEYACDGYESHTTISEAPVDLQGGFGYSNSKYDVPSVVLSPEQRVQVQRAVSAAVHAVPLTCAMRVLTLNESLNNVADMPMFKRVDMTTSSGLLFREKGLLKRDLAEEVDGQLVAGAELEEAVRVVASAMETGYYVPFSQENQKVETRPVLVDGKDASVPVSKQGYKMDLELAGAVVKGSRSINVMGFDFSCYVRMIFAPYISSFYSWHGLGYSSVGMPSVGSAVQRFVEKFAGKRGYLCGDIKGMEFSGTSDFKADLARELRIWFLTNGATEAHADIVQRLVECMFSTMYIQGSSVYQHGVRLPSGIPITTILNTLLRASYAMLGFSEACGLPVEDYGLHVVGEFYGDDSIEGVVSDVPYDNLTCAKALAPYNVTYTPPVKTGEHVAYEHDLSRVVYLGRHLARDSGIWFFRFDVGSLVEMLRFQNGPGLEAFCEKVASLNQEFAMHRLEVYKNFYALVAPYFQTLEGASLPFVWYVMRGLERAGDGLDQEIVDILPGLTPKLEFELDVVELTSSTGVRAVKELVPQGLSDEDAFVPPVVDARHVVVAPARPLVETWADTLVAAWRSLMAMPEVLIVTSVLPILFGIFYVPMNIVLQLWLFKPLRALVRTLGYLYLLPVTIVVRRRRMGPQQAAAFGLRYGTYAIYLAEFARCSIGLCYWVSVIYSIASTNDIVGTSVQPLANDRELLTSGTVTGTLNTTFRDNHEVDFDFAEVELPKPVKIMDPYPSVNLTQVLRRVVQLDNIVWPATAPAGSDLATLVFPRDFLSVRNFQEHLKRFRYFRCGGIRLTFRQNLTKFNYGMLMTSWVPGMHGAFYGYASTSTYAQSMNKAMFLSASRGNTVEFDIPWNTMVQWADITTDIDQAVLGVVKLHVLNALRTTELDAATSGVVSVFVEVLEPEVAGLDPSAIPDLFPQSNNDPMDVEFNPQEKRPTAVEGKTKEKDALREKKLKIIESLPTSTQVDKTRKQNDKAFKEKKGHDNAPKNVPIIGRNIGDTIVDSLKVIGDAAIAAVSSPTFMKALGAMLLDKQTQLQAQTDMRRRFVSDLAFGKGTDMAARLSLQPTAMSVVTPGIVDHRHNPSLHEMMAKPALVHLDTFEGTDTVDTVISSIPVTPMFHAIIPDVLGLRVIQPTYLSWYASMFKYWRGSIKYHVQIVTSKFVTGRIRVSWTPTPYSPSYDGSTEHFSRVIDIEGDTDFEFTIPYLQREFYLETNPEGFFTETYNPNGYITLSVVNELATPSGLLGEADVNVWQAAGEDFQVLLALQAPIPIAIAGDPSFSLLRVDWEHDDDEDLAGIKQLVPQSLDAAFENTFPGLVNFEMIADNGFVAPERYDDLADLWHRYYRTYPPDYPELPSFNDKCDDVIDYLISPFWYCRGSSRYKIWLTPPPEPGQEAFGATYTDQESITGWLYESHPAELTDARVWPLSEVEQPYYATVPFLYTATHHYTNVHAFTTLDGQYYRALGDDFLVGYPRAPPRIIYEEDEPEPPGLADDLSEVKLQE